MHIRSYDERDLAGLIELTIDTFAPSTSSIFVRWWASASLLTNMAAGVRTTMPRCRHCTTHLPAKKV